MRLTGYLFCPFFVCILTPSCLKQVKAGPVDLRPSLCCSLRAPPGSLVFQHYNYPFLPSRLTHVQSNTGRTFTLGVWKHSACSVRCMSGVGCTSREAKQTVMCHRKKRTSPASPFVGLTAHQRQGSDFWLFFPSLVRCEWFHSR